MDSLLFIAIVAAAVARGEREWVIFGVALALIVIAARTGAIKRTWRWFTKQRRQRAAEAKGLEAELGIKHILENAGFPVLHNLYVPHADGSGALTQIDLLALSWQGIQVIEVKGHAGNVEVDPQAPDWAVIYQNGYKAQLHNPIRQNETHVAAIRTFVGENVPISNVVIFPAATLSYTEPTNNVHAAIPYSMETGVPTETTLDAWEKIAEHDRTSDKARLQKIHLKYLKSPRTYDDPPEVRKAKKRAREKWVESCQAELSTNDKCRMVRQVIRELLPTANQAQQESILRYAQAHVTQREIRSQRVSHGQLVAAHRRNSGKSWLSDDEFRHACALENKYKWGGGSQRSKLKPRGSAMTRNEFAFIIGVCIGIIARLK